MEQRLQGLGNAFIQLTDGGQVYFRKNVGGYMSGPTSNGMTQDTSDRESAHIRR